MRPYCFSLLAVTLTSLGSLLALAPRVQAQVPAILGKDWNLRYPQPTADHLNAIATNGTGRVVIVGEHGSIVTSDDLTAWTARSSPTVEHLRDVIWSGTEFVAVGEAGKIIASADGISWVARVSGGSDPIVSIARGASQYVAVGGKTGGVVFTSVDGVAWTRRVVSGATAIKDVIWTGSRFVAVINSVSLTSADGVVWVRHAMPCRARLR